MPVLYVWNAGGERQQMGPWHVGRTRAATAVSCGNIIYGVLRSLNRLAAIVCSIYHSVLAQSTLESEI